MLERCDSIQFDFGGVCASQTVFAWWKCWICALFRWIWGGGSVTTTSRAHLLDVVVIDSLCYLACIITKDGGTDICVDNRIVKIGHIWELELELELGIYRVRCVVKRPKRWLCQDLTIAQNCIESSRRSKRFQYRSKQCIYCLSRIIISQLNK